TGRASRFFHPALQAGIRCRSRFLHRRAGERSACKSRFPRWTRRTAHRGCRGRQSPHGASCQAYLVSNAACVRVGGLVGAPVCRSRFDLEPVWVAPAAMDRICARHIVAAIVRKPLTVARSAQKKNVLNAVTGLKGPSVKEMTVAPCSWAVLAAERVSSA